MANDLTFTQISAILNEIQSQATGSATIAAVDSSSFITSAQTALKTGYDPLMNAISQVLSRTIFSVRPYRRKFGGIEVDQIRFGNRVRKLAVADSDLVNDDRYQYPTAYTTGKTPPTGDGLAVDQQIQRKPKVLETNFYGANVYEDYYTIYKDQLDCAFTTPDEFSRFITMVTTNVTDKLEQVRENIARATIANHIGAILKEGQNGRVIHLLSEYKTLTGLADLTAQSVYQPANFKPFMQWVFARISTISNLMTERSEMFQTVVNEKHVLRHTPLDRQKVYLYAPARFQTETMAIADTYHDNFLRFADNETVNFWQSIETPDSINVKPVYIGTDGALVVPDAAVEQAGIFGVIFDEDALGYTTMQQWSNPAPFNARGGYTTMWIHETQRSWSDLTEKAVVLLLD
nr:MAG TPA: major capsid protein [Caudoviricetes sp.]